MEVLQRSRRQAGEDSDAPLSADDVAALMEEGPDARAGLRAVDRDAEEALLHYSDSGSSRALTAQERAAVLRASAARAAAPGLFTEHQRAEYNQGRSVAIRTDEVGQLEGADMDSDCVIRDGAAHTPLVPGYVLDGAGTTAAGYSMGSKLARRAVSRGDQAAALEALLSEERQAVARELSSEEDLEHARMLPGLTGLRERVPVSRESDEDGGDEVREHSGVDLLDSPILERRLSARGRIALGAGSEDAVEPWMEQVNHGSEGGLYRRNRKQMRSPEELADEVARS